MRNLIKHNGLITIADFMNEAMFNKKTGYYQVKEPIGANKDFITAPEISSIFGELIASYFLSFILKSQKKIAFVEMGAGLGTLAFDIISTFEKIAKKLNKFDELKEKLSFNIIEISHKLTKIQQKKLSAAPFKINWFEDFDNFLEKNQNREIYFVANELFDCFEIHQFSYSNNKWQEIMVGLKNDNFCLILEEFSQQKHNLINKTALENEILPQENIIFEHSFKAQNFMDKLSKTVENQGGMAIIIDYGYEEPPLKSTLQALKNHQGINIFEDVGNCDLTSLVNFKMLQKVAVLNKLQTSLITQREFLRSLKIEEILQNKMSKIIEKNGKKEMQNPLSPNCNINEDNCQVKSAIDRLIDKNQMGELFKFLIIWK